MPVVTVGPKMGGFAHVAHQLVQEGQGAMALSLQAQAQQARAAQAQQGSQIDQQRLAQQMFGQMLNAQLRSAQMEQQAAQQERQFIGKEAQQAIEFGIKYDPLTKAYRPIEDTDPEWPQRKEYLALKKEARQPQYMPFEEFTRREEARLGLRKAYGLIESPGERRVAEEEIAIRGEERRTAAQIAKEEREFERDIKKEERAFGYYSKRFGLRQDATSKKEFLSLYWQAQRALRKKDPKTDDWIYPDETEVEAYLRGAMQMQARFQGAQPAGAQPAGIPQIGESGRLVMPPGAPQQTTAPLAPYTFPAAARLSPDEEAVLRKTVHLQDMARRLAAQGAQRPYIVAQLRQEMSRMGG